MGGSWAERWRALLADQAGDARRRLLEGRAWQRSGRVTGLRIEAGRASGRVQGSRATPYLVEIDVTVLDDSAWARVIEALAAEVRHSARLLAGHAPEGLDLLPAPEELGASCSGHEPFWPCAHVVAVWEAVADRIAQDPFTLVRLRGRGRERLLRDLALARRRAARRDEERADAGMALDDLDVAGWTQARELLVAVEVPPAVLARTPAGPLRLLGDPPGWEGGVSAADLLGPALARAARWALDRDA